MLFTILSLYFTLTNGFIINSNEPQSWAVLVAGSNGYFNYRHQADVAHAYFTLNKRDFNMSNVVVMMYDDVARNHENPFKGQLFNRPDSTLNVYKGIKIDYKADDVTVQNFNNVLLGNITANSSTVIKPKKGDKVFIYMADHGGSNVFCFPNEDLTSNQLEKTIKTLLKKEVKVLLYMEACESGSMFSHWADNLTNFVAMSASSDDESSFAFYFEEKLNTFLGDEFSINFLEDLDKSPPSASLMEHMDIVKLQTDLSHVHFFGDKKMMNMSIKDFLGTHRFEGNLPHALKFNRVLRSEKIQNGFNIEQSKVYEFLLKKQSTTENGMNEYNQYIMKKMNLERIMQTVNTRLSAMSNGVLKKCTYLDDVSSKYYKSVLKFLRKHVDTRKFSFVLLSQHIGPIKNLCCSKSLNMFFVLMELERSLGGTMFK